MRKLILVLPVAALLLAAGILMSEFGRTFSEPVPQSGTQNGSPNADTGAGWQETGGGKPKSGA